MSEESASTSGCLWLEVKDSTAANDALRHLHFSERIPDQARYTGVNLWP